MTAVVRLFTFTLALVALGSSSACITTLCLSALCGEQSASARPAVSTERAAVLELPEAERSEHNCNLMRF